MFWANLNWYFDSSVQSLVCTNVGNEIEDKFTFVLTQWRVLANKRMSRTGSAYLGEIWASVYYLWCNISNVCLMFSIYWGYRWHWPLAAVNQAECGHSGRMERVAFRQGISHHHGPTRLAGDCVKENERWPSFIGRNNQIHLADHFMWRHHPFPRSFLPPFRLSLPLYLGLSELSSGWFGSPAVSSQVSIENRTHLIDLKKKMKIEMFRQLLPLTWLSTNRQLFLPLVMFRFPVTSGGRKWNE